MVESSDKDESERLTNQTLTEGVTGRRDKERPGTTWI